MRDLYGTILNEGASRGILVTTSYYGKEADEFAANKPIKLIDGSNLMYWFKEYGYNVRIDLKNKPNVFRPCKYFCVFSFFRQVIFE